MRQRKLLNHFNKQSSELKRRGKQDMKKITLIGLGKMGSALAKRILHAGFPLTVYNRTIEKIAPISELGAVAATSLQDAVSDADIVITSLLDDQAVLGITDGILAFLKTGAIHIGTSTILPKTAILLAELHQQRNCFYIAAPVLGVPKVANAGQLMTLCAGPQQQIEQVQSILESFSAQVLNLGEKVASANVLKICMNYSVVSAIELISELYAFAEKSGVETAIIQEALHHIYAHPGIKLYIDKIHDRDFDQVNFDMRGGNKDIALFQQAFTEAGVIPDIANAIKGKFTQALAQGMENKDWSAVSEIVRSRAGLE